eukprot:jgi/Bigna1/75275/fgenesh1_pg.33_\
MVSLPPSLPPSLSLSLSLSLFSLSMNGTHVAKDVCVGIRNRFRAYLLFPRGDLVGLAFFAYGVIRYNRMKEWIRSTQVDITCRNDDLPMKQVATVMSIILIAGIAHAIVKMEWWKE